VRTQIEKTTRLAATVTAALLLLALPAVAHADRSATGASVVLAEGAGYHLPHGSQRVRLLQLRLRSLGEHPGPVDGRFGPLSRAAVIAFQRRHGLAVDGVVGEATAALLSRQERRPTALVRKLRSAPSRRLQLARVTSPAGTAGDPIFSLAIGLAFGAVLGLALTRLRAESRRRGQVGSGPINLPQLPPEPRDDPSSSGRPTVLGYASASRDRNREAQDDLREQLEVIAAECRRRDLVLVDVVREHEPERAKGLQRPGLGYALGRIVDGDARGLVVADLSRISRSVTDVGEVLDWFSRADARLVAAHPRLDTGEEHGRLAARTLITVSSSERDRLRARTRKGLEAARLERRRRGRSAVADNPGLNERIATMRAEGMTLQGIADRLNKEGVPTIRGGAKWRPSSVQAAVGYRRPQQRRGVPEADLSGRGEQV
jgi:DNA invertase Pin-like site-specific DNA recombinase